MSSVDSFLAGLALVGHVESFVALAIGVAVGKGVMARRSR